MSVRINGKTFRSGCDIAILMESFAKPDTPKDRERRITLYAERYERGQDLYTGDTLPNFPEMDEQTAEREAYEMSGDEYAGIYGADNFAE